MTRSLLALSLPLGPLHAHPVSLADQLGTLFRDLGIIPGFND